VSQVKMPSWSKGRVVLLGDAAWCAGPFGVGTTEAIVGGYVLAGELHQHGNDYKAAFSAYEDRMRPYVEKGQDVPKINTRISTPQSKLGVTLLNTALKIAGAPGVRQIVAKIAAPPSDDFELPEYKKR
jgi:2-polyprenyl-6-methoxyphenol hydroxylase-like FAD-dependent oxidoreductase